MLPISLLTPKEFELNISIRFSTLKKVDPKIMYTCKYTIPSSLEMSITILFTVINFIFYIYYSYIKIKVISSSTATDEKNCAI